MNRLFFLPLACLLAAPALAQGGAGKPPAPTTSGALKVREQIDDLGLLKSLVALRLTGPQIDALLVPMRSASAAAAQLQKQSDEAVLALSGDVGRAYEDALAGKSIPEKLEKKIAEGTAAAAERYQSARRKAIGEILAVAKVKLSEGQKTEIEKQCIAFYGGKRVPKQYAEKPEKAPKDVVLDLAVQGYIEQVLLFDKSVTLLEKMRTALDKP